MRYWGFTEMPGIFNWNSSKLRPTCSELFFSGFTSIDGYGGHDHLSPDIYEESETDPGTEDLSTRIFVALFDYDPLTMSPNPDAAEEELPFKEGQIIKVGSKPKGKEGSCFTSSCPLFPVEKATCVTRN